MTKSSDSIDAKLDGWLVDWPAPERSDDAWDAFGGKLDERLAELTVGQGEEVWLQAPLPAEPNEGASENKIEAGGASMSEPESDHPQPVKPEPEKKKSLKDFAQRVSVAPSLTDGASQTPVPKATDSPLPSSKAGPSSQLRASSASMISRPPEARDSDSGILDLNAVRNSVASVPDTGAQPAETGLFDDDEKVVAVLPAKKKSSLLPIAGGGLVAVLALAAAAMLVVRAPKDEAPMAAEAMATAPMAASAARATGEGQSEPQPTGLSADGLAVASSNVPGPLEAPTMGENRLELDDEAKSKSAENSKSEESSKDKDGPTDPKDLAGAMATAVGAGEEKKDESKSAGSTVDPGSIPESPSQGAIQGAIGSVKGGAKGCVAGMDAPSRASVTFRSDGTVSGVSVSGAAEGKPAASCIKSALKGARVGPFKRSSFTVGVTLRP